jgi:hypothetical protein
MLLLDKGIAITKEDKFRNQQVIVTIAVPVGKIININKRLGWRNWEHFNGPWRSAEWDWDASWDEDEVDGWENHYGEDLVMRSDGLYTLDGKPADRNINDEHREENNNDWDDDNNRTLPGDSIEGYRYEQTQKSIDSLNALKDKQMQKVKDSLKEVKEQIDRKLEKLENRDSLSTEAYLQLNDRRYDFVLDI